MPQTPLDYEAPAASAYLHPEVKGAAITATTVIVGVNLVLLGIALADRSWNALFVAFIANPIANLVMLGLAFSFRSSVKRASAGASIKLYQRVAIAIPLCAIPVDAIVIFSMGLH